MFRCSDVSMISSGAKTLSTNPLASDVPKEAREARLVAIREEAKIRGAVTGRGVRPPPVRLFRRLRRPPAITAFTS